MQRQSLTGIENFNESEEPKLVFPRNLAVESRANVFCNETSRLDTTVEIISHRQPQEEVKKGRQGFAEHPVFMA